MRKKVDRTEKEIARLVMYGNEDGTFLEVRDPKGAKFTLRCDSPETTLDLDIDMDSGQLICAHLASPEE
jgi:hypothetical protein